MRAEPLRKPLRDPERTAEVPDVLAQEEDRRVVLERVCERLTDGVEEGGVSRSCPRSVSST